MCVETPKVNKLLYMFYYNFHSSYYKTMDQQITIHLTRRNTDIYSSVKKLF